MSKGGPGPARRRLAPDAQSRGALARRAKRPRIERGKACPEKRPARVVI